MSEKKKPRKRARTFPKPLEQGVKMSNLQRLIRRFRVRRGFSRVSLEEASGVYCRTLERWEKDPKANPQIYHVSAVLDAMNLELWVVNRDDGTLVDRIY